MRINVYDHELKFMAERWESVSKTADTGVTFHGIRFYTEAPLMHQPNDDDSSAITIWVPWTKELGRSTKELRQIAAAINTFCHSVEKLSDSD